jgi:hypothetical protein|uniref:Uncharacterized protein n=1 Tax=Populus trichocarpa TaxID=3694 RepID=A0A3N7HVZ5_POPTR
MMNYLELRTRLGKWQIWPPSAVVADVGLGKISLPPFVFVW